MVGHFNYQYEGGYICFRRVQLGPLELPNGIALNIINIMGCWNIWMQRKNKIFKNGNPTILLEAYVKEKFDLMGTQNYSQVSSSFPGLDKGISITSSF